MFAFANYTVLANHMAGFPRVRWHYLHASSSLSHFSLQNNIVLRHGAPTVVITDRGTAFTAELMQCLMRMTHTDHRKTTAYHPQSNGLTERLNRTLADMLSMYVDVEHKMWDEILPYVTFAYNTAVQETTRATPLQLVYYGRAVTTTLDAMLSIDDYDYPPDLGDFLQRAEEARQLAR